jgi:drug/metabolite transporter (DMT)-like permease
VNIFLLIAGVSSGILHGIYSAVSKSLLKHRIKEPFLFFLYISLLQAVITPFLWLFVRPVVPPLSGWTPLLMAGITGVIAFLFLYMALSSGDASSVMPIMGSKVIFAGFLAIFMLNEKHNWTIYSAAILVAISIGILSYSPSPGRKSKFSVRPIFLMILCSIVFAFTDNFITRSLKYIDSYNFMVYYNLILGIGSLAVIPFLMKRKTTSSPDFAVNVAGFGGALPQKFSKIQSTLLLSGKDLWWISISAIFLLAATLLLTVSFEIADGVVIPNILVSTRGVFVVLISAVLSHHGSTLLETQTSKTYLLRLVASSLIILSIWITLR